MREKLDSNGGLRLRFLTAIAAAAIVVLAPASSAGAAVTIGQLAPAPSADCLGSSPADRAQPTVTSGNTYVVPGDGAITAWSHNAAAGSSQQLTMKIFRKVAEPSTYMVVGHDGPRDLAAGVTNAFAANVPVKSGDVLGLNQASPSNTACHFAVPGDRSVFRPGNLGDGQSGDFGFTLSNTRLNISAVFTFSNTFTLGEIRRNKKKGTATLTINLPNPGELTASGKGVNAAGAAEISKAVTAGTASLLIKARGKKKRKLKDTGRVKLNLAITYTPTGGDSRTQSSKVKLKKNL